MATPLDALIKAAKAWREDPSSDRLAIRLVEAVDHHEDSAFASPVALCPCGFTTKLAPRSAAFHRAHRANHVEVFPRLDAQTLANLDALVVVFERKEAVAEVRS